MFHLGSVTSIALKIPQNIVKPNGDAIQKTRKLGFTFSIHKTVLLLSGCSVGVHVGSCWTVQPNLRNLDIAGTAWDMKGSSYVPKTASGYGVRLLVQLAQDWKAES